MVLFSAASEKDVTRAIVEEFTKEFLNHVETDVIIVGGVQAGLSLPGTLHRQRSRHS